MVSVISTRRRSPVLTPSSLACLSTLPTINLTAGCLHDCAYCYIRAYRNYPGAGRIILYEDTLERLKAELRQVSIKPRAVYFSPSSDLFQPAEQLLELTHSILQLLFAEGVGVAFLTRGLIPDETLELLVEHRALVRAQIGLLTIDEGIAQAFEPHAARPRDRLWQLAALIEGGIAAEARIDPILPNLTDSEEALDRHFEALEQMGVKRAAAGVLFLRPGIRYWLRRDVRDASQLSSLLHAYEQAEDTHMRGSPYPVQSAPAEVRRAILERVRAAALTHGVELRVCACKNADIASGTCNIAGTWPSRVPSPRLPCPCGLARLSTKIPSSSRVGK